MSATSAPFGFRPSYHNSGVVRQKAYTITSGLATDIFSGDPVKLNDNGTVQLGTSDGLRGGTVATINLLGILSGVEYTDSLGKPTLSNYWPSGTSVLANTTVTAWVYDDRRLCSTFSLPIRALQVPFSQLLATKLTGSMLQAALLRQVLALHPLEQVKLLDSSRLLDFLITLPML